jgi:hypothetical protein
VDVLALLQSWLGDLHQLSSSIHTLAGTPPAPPGAPTHSSSGPWHTRSSSKGMVGEPTPLLPSAVASSHAPHLAAQLGAHGGCLEGLRALRSQVAAQLVTAGEGGWRWCCCRGFCCCGWSSRSACTPQCSQGRCLVHCLP